MKDIPGKGKGLIASADICQHDLVATYAGIVMSAVNAQKHEHLKHYLVAAFEGPGTQ